MCTTKVVHKYKNNKNLLRGTGWEELKFKKLSLLRGSGGHQFCMFLKSTGQNRFHPVERDTVTQQ